ncbi:hypothetical protein [Hymenobacter cellulosivorans]|uniref:Uncharacterized protein n=1 Tax=Hymenobacter cellulosivorans TaxID=2932249 RepID=A0ABY4F4Z2_9BACT|nr:hypothetical protein [Hymenobacter cellulosivorans]UOQ51728.1 hypothetical protein MUN80_18425 [Hymenobacter cellulosivorans]
MRELASTPNPDARALLAEVSVGLTLAQAAAAPKLFQLRKQVGESVLVKLLVVILRAFVDSLRVQDKPDAADILELADTLAQTYTHDSLKDIILALKEARTNGTKFYQALDSAKIYELIRTYFDRKAKYLENGHLDQKAQGASQQAVAIHQLQQVTPQLVASIGRQIPPDHPNAEHLRQRLTIINQKQRRGLLTEKEAEQQRAEVQQATQRKARSDWQPSPEAQQAINRRGRDTTRRFAERHGINPNHL